MTKEQVVKFLTDYAANNNEYCDFKEDSKGCFTSIVVWEISEGCLKDYLVWQLFNIYNEGYLTSEIKVWFEIPENRFDDVEKFLSLVNEENEVIEFWLFEEGSIYASLQYDYSEDAFFDDEIMDAIFYMPFSVLNVYVEALLLVIHGKCSPEEAFSNIRNKDNSSDEKNESISFGDVRYFFEHRLLPNFFYKNTSAFVQSVLEQDRGELYGMMCELCEKNEIDIKYTKEQYKIFHHKFNKGYSIVRIVMPEPIRQTECYEVYLVFSDDYQKKRYFTIEKGTSHKDRFLCSWDSNGMHGNYGDCKRDVSKIEKDIIKIWSTVE